MVGWLCFTSHRQRGHLEKAPLLFLSNDEKLGKYTVPIGNQTQGCRMAWKIKTMKELRILKPYKIS